MERWVGWYNVATRGTGHGFECDIACITVDTRFYKPLDKDINRYIQTRVRIYVERYVQGRKH